MKDKITAWRCVVCGYIHRGEKAPNICPVCGAPEIHFEPYLETKEPATTAKPKKWRCLVCGYIHTGDSPPDPCPVCAQPAERFEPLEETPETGSSTTGKTEKIVIVGSGIAAISAAESIRQFSPNHKITILAKEPTLPYYRLNLTRLLAGEVTENQLPIHPEKWYEENNIQLVKNAEVSSLSPDSNKVSTTNGQSFPYDKLILAAGAHPFLPPIAGIAREGVTSIRTLPDAKRVLLEAKNANQIAVIGGGILGLETAGALAKQGNKVTLIENFKWLMPRQLNQTAAKLLQKHVESLGITLKINTGVTELSGDERVASVNLENGETLPANLVIITAGVRANSYLARMAGLKVNYGLIVNDFMQTSVPEIYAAGDIAEHRGTMYGLWNAAQYQGRIAGMNAAGQEVEFGGIPRSNALKVLGVDLLSIGKFEAQDGGDSVMEAECEDYYCRFLFRDNHLAGAILYGNTTVSGAVKKAIEEREDFSSLLKTKPNASNVWDFFIAKGSGVPAP